MWLCRLTCGLEGAWEQGDVIQAEADSRFRPTALKAEAGHLAKLRDAATQTVLEQHSHSAQTTSALSLGCKLWRVESAPSIALA